MVGCLKDKNSNREITCVKAEIVSDFGLHVADLQAPQVRNFASRVFIQIKKARLNASGVFLKAFAPHQLVQIRAGGTILQSAFRGRVM